MLDSKHIIFTVVLLLLLLWVILPNNQESDSNNRLREKCEAEHGTFARSIKPAYSLCYLPRKE